MKYKLGNLIECASAFRSIRGVKVTLSKQREISKFLNKVQEEYSIFAEIDKEFKSEFFSTETSSERKEELGAELTNLNEKEIELDVFPFTLEELEAKIELSVNDWESLEKLLTEENENDTKN